MDTKSAATNRATSTGLEIANLTQRLVFRAEDGALLTYVRCGEAWEPLFDAGMPLLQGPHFDLRASRCQPLLLDNGVQGLLLSGRHAEPDYAWDARIQARDDSPWIRIRITCHLTEPIALETPEPTAALWMDRGDVDVTVDQGPVSLYGGNSWGNSFPAGYLWSEGKEAAFFFNPEPVTWMSASGMQGFLDYRVATITQGDRTGLGLHALTHAGDTIPATHLVVEYFLYAAERKERPTRLQGLARTVELCAERLPASAPFPENRVPPYETTWRVFADGVIRDLRRENISWGDLPSAWRDEPLFPENAVSVFRAHSDYSTFSSNTPKLNRETVFRVWDCATCNNFLAPWLAYLRLHPDPEQDEFLKVKVANVPQFYDREARLFRWGAEGVKLTQGNASAMANGVEMSWENFMFTLEPVKVHDVLPAERFDPALAGRFLMACQGLIAYAHNVHYVFPQWFDAYHKTETMQLDIPALGKVREPFQAGTYAYLMLSAHRMTGEKRYLGEGRTALRTLLEDMGYTAVNARYRADYRDPVDFPVAETFGNGYAVAAAHWIYRLTGDEEFRRYAWDYFHLLARMFFWYDDKTDAVARDLNNRGLFRAHGGHYGTCPWENIEAYLPLLPLLKYEDRPHPLLLKMFNLQRATSFYYFPPVWTDLVAAPNPKLYHHVCQYLPIENFYTLEFGGTHGSMGRCIYMCSIALYNYLLYEALAECQDRDVMVLNLDVLEEPQASLAGWERNLIVFNSSAVEKDIEVRSKHLKPGSYAVAIRDGASEAREQRLTHAQLAGGLRLNLKPMQSATVALRHEHADTMRATDAECRAAQGKLAHVYQRLQETARDHGTDARLLDLKQRYLKALHSYREGHFTEGAQAAGKVLKDILGGG